MVPDRLLRQEQLGRDVGVGRTGDEQGQQTESEQGGNEQETAASDEQQAGEDQREAMEQALKDAEAAQENGEGRAAPPLDPAAAEKQPPLHWMADLRSQVEAQGKALVERGVPRFSGWPDDTDAAGAAQRFRDEAGELVAGLQAWPDAWDVALSQRWLD